MGKYLDLNRQFGHLVNYSATELLALSVRGRRLTWDQILKSRFSVIVGRANFGKSVEFKAQSKALRRLGRISIYVALHRVLGEEALEDALEVEDWDAYRHWQETGGEITVFVDSLDEVSLASESGVRKALRSVCKALHWPNSDVKWVLSSRPAVLTDDVLGVLQAELRTTLYAPDKDREELIFDEDEAQEDASIIDDADSGDDIESSDATSKLGNKVVEHEQLKIYALLPLDHAAAVLYLTEHVGINQPNDTLLAASQYGLARLADSPGGLDVLGHIDPIQNPPQSLTQVFNRITDAMQEQQRKDPREKRLSTGSPMDFEHAIQTLASASVVCGLPNIELSPAALKYREGVLSAQPIVASLLSESSLQYLLGSRLFIDSGHHQVKLYPDDLLPFLAAKRLAGLVTSPDQAKQLLNNFTWRSTTGECGVYRALLNLAGWLSVFSTHCRKELLEIDPQAVAFFGDLRSPDVPLADAVRALERSVERLVQNGDSIGRLHFTLTAENYWQVIRPGMTTVLARLYQMYGSDWHAKEVLLEIAGRASLDLYRDSVLDAVDRDYVRLLNEPLDLRYILALGRQDDFDALGAAVLKLPQLDESQLARVMTVVAWKGLSAKSIAKLVGQQFARGRGGYSVSWALTGAVAETASDPDLCRLVSSLLSRLVKAQIQPGRDSEQYRTDQKFVELVMDILALLVNRPAIKVSTAVKFCLVLNRYVTKNYYGHASITKLRAALRSHKTIRLALLRALISRTDKTFEGISDAFSYQSVYPHVEGDEVELGEPAFAELVETWARNASRLKSRPSEVRKRVFVIDRKLKEVLTTELAEIRSGKQVNVFVWVGRWLYDTVQKSRYGDCNFALFEKAAGGEIAGAVREGLSNLWRHRDPTWNESEPHSTYNITIAGLQGLFLDLGDGSAIPQLGEAEVRRAVRYALFEINEFPKWFWGLVNAYLPIATSELKLTLSNAGNGPVSKDKAETLICRLDEASKEIQLQLASDAWDYVLTTPSVGEYTSKMALKVAAANGVIDQVAFEQESSRLMAAAFTDSLASRGEVEAASQQELQAGPDLINDQDRLRANALTWGGLWLCLYPGTFIKAWQKWRVTHASSANDFT